MPRRVVLGEGLAVGQRHRDDLAGEEAVVLGGDGALLAAQGELVHLLARDLLAGGDVLRRLPHRDVDVGKAFAVAGLQPWILGLGVVGAAVEKARDALDADAEEDVTLTGVDGVGRHPGGLQRRRAVAGDGGAGHVHAGEDGDVAADVEALLATGQAAAADEVLDLAAVELRYLVEDLVDDLSRQVVGTHLDQ